MEKSKEDIKLDKIGKLLELGGTMLANHCECGAPLFRYHGNIICPICDSDLKADIESKDKIKKNKKKPVEKSSSKPSQPSEPPQTNNETSNAIREHQHQSINVPFTESQQVPKYPAGTPSHISPETVEFISNTIVNKVVQLCLELQRETDQGRIKHQMEAIESGIRALKNLR